MNHQYNEREKNLQTAQILQILMLSCVLLALAKWESMPTGALPHWIPLDKESYADLRLGCTAPDSQGYPEKLCSKTKQNNKTKLT